MELKRRISFKLRAYGKKISYQIQMHVTFNSQRIVLSTGCLIDSLKVWNSNEQLVDATYKGSRGETGLDINAELRKEREMMEIVFKFFEVNEIVPTVEQVYQQFKERKNGGKHIREVRVEKEQLNLFDVFDAFVRECGEKNAWTNATFEKMAALKADLMSFKKNVQFSDLNESGLTSFVHYLRDEKVLRTPRKKKNSHQEYDRDDIIGLKNSTIKKKLDFLSWFLKWATEQGYNQTLAYKSFRPTLKSTQKKVVYLTKQEMEQLKALTIPKESEHLENIRDVFLFCCFSGLRHSDVFNLKRNDIKGDHIEITTVKTADSIAIELNSVTRNILDKYKYATFSGNKALPVIANQAMNRELKELCRLAGINEKIRITSYSGNIRKDEIKEKWELIGTHTGRRTFIVTCLSLGIAPNVVMKWTGHSDYKSMKPYIDIVDEIKASEMTKLDGMI